MEPSPPRRSDLSFSIIFDPSELDTKPSLWCRKRSIIGKCLAVNDSTWVFLIPTLSVKRWLVRIITLPRIRHNFFQPVVMDLPAHVLNFNITTLPIEILPSDWSSTPSNPKDLTPSVVSGNPCVRARKICRSLPREAWVRFRSVRSHRNKRETRSSIATWLLGSALFLAAHGINNCFSLPLPLSLPLSWVITQSISLHYDPHKISPHFSLKRVPTPLGPIPEPIALGGRCTLWSPIVRAVKSVSLVATSSFSWNGGHYQIKLCLLFKILPSAWKFHPNVNCAIAARLAKAVTKFSDLRCLPQFEIPLYCGLVSSLPSYARFRYMYSSARSSSPDHMIAACGLNSRNCNQHFNKYPASQQEQPSRPKWW
jgi:hypothetical protein